MKNSIETVIESTKMALRDFAEELSSSSLGRLTVGLGVGLILSLVVILTLSGCGVQSPKRVNPIEGVAGVSLEAEQTKIDATTKVDVLFVLDDSSSMQQHIDKVRNNINRFVDGFGKNTLVDFHVGITMIYDRRKYGVTIKDFPAWGQLIPLRDAKGTLIEGPRFVTRDTPDFKGVLRKTLDVPVHHDNAPGRPLDNGPEWEELLSPIVKSFKTDDPAVQAANTGFRRTDSYFISVTVSDADDASEMSSDEAYSEILASVNGLQDHYIPIGVMSPTGTSCPKDTTTGANPIKYEGFVRSHRGKVLNLCDTKFGDKLAKVGDDLVQRVARKVIKLPAIIDFAGCVANSKAKALGQKIADSVRKNPYERFQERMRQCVQVDCGDQKIPFDREKGWAYDRDNVAIELSGQLELDKKCDITMNYTKASWINRRKGLTKVMSPSDALIDNQDEENSGGIREKTTTAPTPKNVKARTGRNGQKAEIAPPEPSSSNDD